MNKNLTISLLLCSLFQFSMMVISSIIGEISITFTNITFTNIQLLATLPDLFIMIFSIWVGRLLLYKSSKKLMGIAIIGFIIVGVGGFTLNQNYFLLLIWSIFLGSSIGILMPTVVAIINNEFEGSYKTRLLGFQNSAVSFGALILTGLSGIIANYDWRYSYLLFLGIIPIAFIFNLSFKNEKQKECIKISFSNLNLKVIIGRGIFIMLFFSIYNALPTNISLILEQKEIYTSINASFAIVFQLLGSITSGLFYDVLSKQLGFKIDIFGLLLLLVGLLVVRLSTTYYMILLGMFLSGTSISIMMSASTELVWKNEVNEFANYSTAIVLAFSDGGGFVTSLYSVIAFKIFKIIDYRYTMLLLIFTCFSMIIYKLWKVTHKSCAIKQFKL